MSFVRPMKQVQQKERPFDDEAYRRYLHEQPCRRCGKPECQAAHLGHARGLGYKEAVDFCVSLCPDCHREFDTAPEGKSTWWMNMVAIPEARRDYAMWKASPMERPDDE